MAQGKAQKIHSFFVDWVSVLKKVDRSTEILSVHIPLKDAFFETNVGKINYSILKYLDSLKPSDDDDDDGNDNDNESVPHLGESTTIDEKFDNSQYESVYELFHDLKVACVIKLLEVEDDSKLYHKVDRFYKIASELLLRECLRLGLSIGDAKKEQEEKEKKEGKKKQKKKKENDGDEEKSDENGNKLDHSESGFDMETSLEETLARDFELITGTYIDKAGEALSMVAAGNLPLFTSLNKVKSELDDREPIIDPALGVSLVKIIPNLDSLKSEKLAFVSPRIQQPEGTTEILQSYMHPNWLRLTASQWLKHGDDDANFSFAPTFDESRSTISNRWKGVTWLQEIGFKRLKDVKDEYRHCLEEEEEEGEEEGEEEVADEEIVEAETNDDVKEKQADDDESNEDEISDDDTGSQIDLANIFKWNVGNKIDDADKESIRNNNVQKQISKSLLELNELRKSRITFQRQQLAAQQQFFAQQAQQGVNGYSADYKIIRASKQEVEKYHKLKRLISGLLKSKDINPSKLNLKLSTKLPVLQHNYSGTLPSSFVGSNHFGRYGSSRASKRRR
ncbi:DEKNAAC103564 [Brettanomyces naardenensis]|uniref:DEKNAAC103564 n=1 Tax=Brettanomyces naardenensis TaxID=13370 RepID=A0A448YNE5_BRENA|nr:DEKNAAC103564 [Brettanomyces naardenensis]